MTKAGIFAWFSYPLPIGERLRLIKSTGFDAVSLWWGDEDRQRQPDMARKLGLEIDNIHTPFLNPNDLWLDNLAGEEYLKTLIQCVEDCARHGIPVAVVHITGFTAKPEISETGMERVRRLVGCSEENGVCLALENMVHLQHLDAIFERIKSNALGFCFDSGHEHCSGQGDDCLGKYGGRLAAVHLDDNFGDNDTHLLPYDGTVSWKTIKEKLRSSKKIPYMTLEVNFNEIHEKSQIYSALPAEEYLALARQKLQKLIEPG